MGSGRSPKRRVRDDDLILGYPRISSDYPRISSNRLSIGGSTSGSFRWNLELQDFVAGAVFGEVGGWLDLLHALEMRCHMWRRSLMTFILRGRRSIWWGWRVTSLAPRIGNAVSYVTQIIDDTDFVWQAQYLVRLEGGFTCSTHWKWRFICDADQRHCLCNRGSTLHLGFHCSLVVMVMAGSISLGQQWWRRMW